ncbi:hypothetical protein [Streptomyces poriferorum]|uniref:Uncharacterized protein n=1 Tax=Streptomyces poriferorum TaxID=2798799 RepID=A0ABY9INC0_9ACTN|nr:MULTISPECIES: hypothetical protein [unclassified Streptomyces]MDP5315295.1 hypothetical protein [Streptomyces sp. Alt4]WLQ55844.1 hypothetical protein P8A19_10480 [Streptomyces sp. Alt2]
MTTHRYDGSQVLFRQAKARSLAAQRFAREAEQEQAAGSSGMERKQRERDAVIATLILAQGAAEGYANWVFLQADVTPSGTWIDRWCGLRNAASSLGRDDKFGLPKEHRAFFEELDAWRNYLLHSDEKSRNSLRRALEVQGHTDISTEVDLLDGAYAVSVMEKTEAACRWAEPRIGVPAPFSHGAWVETDEC